MRQQGQRAEHAEYLCKLTLQRRSNVQLREWIGVYRSKSMRAFDPSVAPAHRISLFRRHGRKIHCVFTAAPRQSGLAGADRLRIWSSILRCFQKSDLFFSVRAGPQSLAMQKPQNHVRKPAGSGRSLDSQRERPVFGIPRIPGPGRISNATRSIHPADIDHSAWKGSSSPSGPDMRPFHPTKFAIFQRKKGLPGKPCFWPYAVAVFTACGSSLLPKLFGSLLRKTSPLS